MNVIKFMILVLVITLVLFILGISYLVQKVNNNHEDLSLEQKFTNMLTILVGIWSIGSLISLIVIAVLFMTFRKPVTCDTTDIHYESGESFSTRGLPTVIDNENPTHIETIRYKWGFLYLDESKLHVNLSDN